MKSSSKTILFIFCIASSFFLSGCKLGEVPDKMDRTNQSIEEMIQQVERTNASIYKQAKLISFENMLKAENTAQLFPVPTRLIPYGRELAQIISAQEILELSYLWLKEVDEVFPPLRVDKKGNDIPYTNKEIEKINHNKMARLLGLQIVSGFLPEQTVLELIENEVYTGGRYEELAYTILMLRAQFIRDILLDASLLYEPLNNPGKLAQAVEYNKSLDFISKLPFAHRIQLKTKGFIPKEISPSEKLDPEVAYRNWLRIRTAAETECRVTERVLTGDENQDQLLYQKRLASYNKSMEVINAYIDSWPEPTGGYLF